MSSVLRKNWDRAFSKNREIKEDWLCSFVNQKRDLGAAGDGIEIFLQDFEGSDLDDKVEELKAFTASLPLQFLQDGIGSAGLRRSAWLDQRSIAGQKRGDENPLTATQLYESRQIPRIGSENAPDSDRSLTYIKNLDAAYMLALTETAVSHEVPLLRDAIWKHYDRQTSLRVKVPNRGYKIFQLEFHLGYFQFHSTPPNEVNQGEAATCPLGWTDLSFLEEMDTLKAAAENRYGMSEVQFSFVICGIHDRRWSAYAFDNTESADGDDLQDKIFCGGGHWDPIGSCLSVDDVQAELPIWNPREYFLNVVARRLGLAADSWETLLRAIERRIKRYRNRHPSTLAGGKRDKGETVKTFDWTRQTIELVDKLRKTLSETNKQWEHFKINNGDVDYFSDSTTSDNDSVNAQDQMKPLLCEIGEIFQRLETVERTLEDLSASCKDSANALQLRLSLESNENAQLQLQLAAESVKHAQDQLQHAQLHLRLAEQSNEAMKTNSASTDFQIFILFPIAVAAAILQYSPNLMPLPAAPSVVILTAVFIIAIKLLHVIFRRLPGLGQCWEHTKAAVKAMKLKTSAGTIIGDNSNSC
ncbi:hypothetical protein L207DRAFT_593560 [Hyaloscypha variabilis F]|uniref:Uncharacterized protein n=1 Tax=Hyaloscypha variabilis (strain UAMH 11265 / GT02V1 / F) TaxID=1149755 RepID=A0A2J6QSS4_HYAVF|nr:hypothetical protein L207DRAFT_593560 [Hyaloscypha variabilis F]